tara:strand:- start:881 stop:1168 length:288 start_codon:yes stop_codon:yes gene_type:complete
LPLTEKGIPFKKNGRRDNFIHVNSNHNLNNNSFIEMTSIPHEPNIVDQEQKDVYVGLQKIVGDACEEWLIKKGLATQSFRETVSQGFTPSKKKKD